MKFIFSILLIIISISVFFFITNPLRVDVSDLRTEVSTYNLALEHSTELQKTRDQLVDSYKNIDKKDKERLEHFLPNTVNNIKFILEIERIANAYSIPIKNVKFQSEKISDPKTVTNSNTTVITSSKPETNSPYGSFPIEFTTESDYDTFVLFLKDVEHNLRLVDIKSVSFTVPSADKNTPNFNPNIYTFNLKVETYWLK